MNCSLGKARIIKESYAIPMVFGIVKRMFKTVYKSYHNKSMDERSNGHVVKKQLKCAVSSCFDRQDICCKECNIKGCRYKCNYLDKEVCEHQITL